MRAIDQLAQIRVLYAKVTGGLSDEELFRVPKGFANHVAWNAAHVVVTQQLLHYKLSGLETPLDAELIDRYRKGTGPDTADLASYRAVMDFGGEAAARLAADHARGAFQVYEGYQTSAGVLLESLDDALIFNNVHEGIHLGYVLAMKRALA